MGALSRGRPYPPPSSALMVAFSLRRNLGTDFHRTVSMTSVLRSASIRGVGFWRDTSSDCQIDEISRFRQSSSRLCEYGLTGPAALRSSASVRSSCTRFCLSRMVRRLTSVGWAVRTSSTVWLLRVSQTSALPIPTSFTR